ncbi:Protein of unknown function DUF1690 [Phaffia rhodozyma]|uniref:DUF1690 domain-containing protein n=1 Tax=Phaffia rhodozyma TaxID=264483 RepID=A0A0F7SPE5_PHARH|nr:Protein of unknown function DUF1690 [Phaffia rhodozyma]
MGAQQSSPASPVSEKVFYPASQAGTVQFSPELIAQLSDPSTAASPSQARQSSIDEHIRQKLESSLQSLKAQEASLNAQLHAELQASNLSTEKSASGSGTSSEILRRDIEEIREKVERFEKKRSLSDWPEINQTKENIKQCYLKNPTTPLDCWREVEDFKAAAEKLEQSFVMSLK